MTLYNVMTIYLKYFVSVHFVGFRTSSSLKHVDTAIKRIRKSLDFGKQACVQNFDNEPRSCEHGNLSSCRRATHSFPVVAY